ncbi:MAG: hypothetical protein AB9835_11825 [Eubacteriales bacterium]
MNKNTALVCGYSVNESFSLSGRTFFGESAHKIAVHSLLCAGFKQVLSVPDGGTYDADYSFTPFGGDTPPALSGMVFVLSPEAPYMAEYDMEKLMLHGEDASYEDSSFTCAAFLHSKRIGTFFTGNYFPDGLRPLRLKDGRIASLSALRRKEKECGERVLDSFCECGVEIHGDCVISPFAKIGAGTVVLEGTRIDGGCVVGQGCVLGPNTLVSQSVIEDGCAVNSCQIYSSHLEKNVKMGPFCHIRPNCHIGEGVKIGDFVEVKNSVLGAGTHISHLTYVGDSDVGQNVNFGCGCATANYDGINKFRTTVGDNAFIGCGTSLVAPVKIGNWGYTAAGSTITRDVPDYALAISRAREQTTIEGWVKRKRGIKD